jgi:glycosyltransferase involved in cell wall biosynthesis
MMQCTDRTYILHAPNIHTGGGITLLLAFVQAAAGTLHFAQYDKRAEALLAPLPLVTDCVYVERSMLGRVAAEWRLYRRSTASSVVLCFHGLPPLLPVRGRVVVLLQNALLLTSESLAAYPLGTRLRLGLERWLLRYRAGCSGRITYIVQTPAMAQLAKQALGDTQHIVVLPFIAPAVVPCVAPAAPPLRDYDFIYVASGEAHKNHANLLAAWGLLAAAGLRPSLALTIHPQRFPALAADIAQQTQRFGLNIINLGALSAPEVARLYQSAGALMFPSTTESLGLPLLEAMQYGLPVLAPELDYVRDVIVPAETFDPYAPVSIARAVRRFLQQPEPPVQIKSAADLLTEILR